MANIKKYIVAGIGIAVVIAIAISFTSYLGQFEQVQKQDDIDSSAIVTVSAPILGSESASVTIIEIGDYQCEMCKRWFDHSRSQIIDNYINTGKVNMVFLDMPILGNDSSIAAEATYCANDQGRYWDYHVTLFEHQEKMNSGWANNERLKSFAFSLGLDMEEFSQCLDSKHYYSQIKLNAEKSKNMGASSTPSFIIVNTSGEQKGIRGAQPYTTFEEVIESLL